MKKSGLCDNRGNHNKRTREHVYSKLGRGKTKNIIDKPLPAVLEDTRVNVVNLILENYSDTLMKGVKKLSA